MAERPEPRKRMSREDRRELILECAIRRFAERGFTDATMADIASEVGVTEPLLYKHFSGKEKLFRAVFERVTDFFVERITEIVARGGSPYGTLRSIATFYYRHLDANPEFATILYQVSAHSSRGIQGMREPLEHIERTLLGLRDVVAELIREGQRLGEIAPEMDPATSAWIFIGNYNILILMKAFEAEEFSEELVLKMVDTITGRLGTPGGDPD